MISLEGVEVQVLLMGKAQEEADCPHEERVVHHRRVHGRHQAFL